MDKFLGWRKFAVVVLTIVLTFAACAFGWAITETAGWLLMGSIAAFFGANVTSKFSSKFGPADSQPVEPTGEKE